MDPAIDLKTPVREQVNRMDAATYFQTLAALMKDNPPAQEDADLVAKLAKIGLVPGQVATQKMEHTIPFILQFDESLDVGSDTLTGVNDADYQPPFKFSGKINKITLTIDPPQLSPEDIKKLEAAQHNKKSSE